MTERENKAIQGTRRLMETGPNPNAGRVSLLPTQLISARFDKPRQFVVTMGQLTTANSVAPWVNNFDGATALPVPLIFGAPGLPTNTGALTSLLQVGIRWGAGGVAYESKHDYPVMGGVFGITADQIDINVKLRSDLAQNGVTPDMVPVVGAFMVEGMSEDPLSVRWAEDKQALGAAPEARFWSVKPYAKKLHIVAPYAAAVAAPGTLLTGQFLAMTGVGAGTVGLSTFAGPQAVPNAGVDIEVDVPSQAELLVISNLNAVGTLIFLEWKGGYS